jgi:hypothetical protein
VRRVDGFVIGGYIGISRALFAEEKTCKKRLATKKKQQRWRLV